MQVERATGFFVLVLLAMAVLLIGPAVSEAERLQLAAAVVLVSSGLAVPLLLWRGRALVRALEGSPLGRNRLVSRVLHKFDALASALLEYGSDRRALLVTCAVSMLFYGVLVLSQYAVVHALHGDVSLWHVALVAPLVILVSALPISINGIGLAEGAFVLLYAHVGLPPATALAAALLRRVVILFVSLAGAVLWLAERRPARSQADPAGASPDGAPAESRPHFLPAQGDPMQRSAPAVVSVITDIVAGLWWLRSFLAEEPDARAVQTRCENPPDARRVEMYLAGCLLFSLGVKLFLDAELGVDPLYSMVIGMVEAVDLPFVGVGLVAGAVTAAFLVLWSAWCKRLPPLTVFVTIAGVGFLVDLWNLIGLDRWTAALLAPTPMMLAGLLLEAYASALIIMSGIGLRVMDLVAVAATRRYGCSFLTAKMSLEAGFFAAALLLGGPVGVATVAFLVLVAPFIPSFMWVNGRFLHLPNHGLATTTPAGAKIAAPRPASGHGRRSSQAGGAAL
jgi:uncharacterized protein